MADHDELLARLVAMERVGDARPWERFIAQPLGSSGACVVRPRGPAISCDLSVLAWIDRQGERGLLEVERHAGGIREFRITSIGYAQVADVTPSDD